MTREKFIDALILAFASLIACLIFLAVIKFVGIPTPLKIFLNVTTAIALAVIIQNPIAALSNSNGYTPQRFSTGWSLEVIFTGMGIANVISGNFEFSWYQLIGLIFLFPAPEELAMETLDNLGEWMLEQGVSRGFIKLFAITIIILPILIYSIKFLFMGFWWLWDQAF